MRFSTYLATLLVLLQIYGVTYHRDARGSETTQRSESVWDGRASRRISDRNGLLFSESDIMQTTWTRLADVEQKSRLGTRVYCTCISNMY